MPKSIIREYDNSQANVTLSSNFAVVVPGYLGNATDPDVDKAKLEGIYLDGVYILNSVSQFDTYIGPHRGDAEEADAPVLENINPAAIADFDKLYRKLGLQDIMALTSETTEYYLRTTLSSGDEGYGEDGYLLKTFKQEDYPSLATDITIRFTPVTKTEIIEDYNTETQRTTNEYSRITPENVGVNAVAEAHRGNQIAYELLKLGYTVLYKPLSTTEQATTQLRRASFWEQFKNKSTFTFRYLMSGGCYDSTVAERMSEVAVFNNDITLDDAETYGVDNGRGDCIALCDIDENYKDGDNPSALEARTQAELLTALGKAIDCLPGNKYTAIFGPRVVYNMTAEDKFGGNTMFPCSFHYLACAASARQKYAEWYAVAGYTRGVSTKSVAYTTITLGEIAINTLAPRSLAAQGAARHNYVTRAANLILSERGSYYLWGNRTSYLLEAAGLKFSHFLNIRQLCCTLKQRLYQASRQFAFDPNSDLLWINFVNAIRPTLEGMKNDQGIEDYKISRVVVKDQKAVLKAKIRIVPIEAVEDFDISVYLEDSLTGINVSADEEVAE